MLLAHAGELEHLLGRAVGWLMLTIAFVVAVWFVRLLWRSR